jgi:uncharacterized protein (TIGR02246 family)
MTTAPDELAIRTLIEAWAAAVRRKDLQAILAHHSPDIVMFDVPPSPDTQGIDAYRKTWDTFFRWSHEPVVYRIESLHVTAGHDVAFAVASMHCAGTEKNGKEIDLAFRLTVGLKKIDGEWTVVHEHHSIPATD